MKKIIPIMVLIFCLVCTVFAGCNKKGKHGDFYPYILTDYVELGDVYDVEVSLVSGAVTEDDIEAKIKQTLEEKKLTTQNAKTGKIVTGDTANIDFVGYIDGKTFEGGDAKGYSLKIGSGSFIEGFETGLIGKKAGDKATLNLKFPENYNKEFAGKKVVFEVTINSVTETVYPELTDSIVAEISSQKNVDEYYEYVRKTVTEEKAEEVKTTNLENVVSAVIDCCKIKKYPKNEVSNYKNKFISQYESVAQNQGLDLETFVQYSGYTMDEFEELMTDNAKRLVAKEMIFLMIADNNGLEISSKEYDDNLASYMEQNGYTSKETFLDAIGKDRFEGILLVDEAAEYMVNFISKR